MIAICIESSNSRGMGHLFRSLLYAEFLKKRNEQFIYLINNDEPSLKILSEKGIDYIIVDFSDIASNWEGKLIAQYDIDVWFNDKFETDYEMGKNICNCNILFCAIDDVGAGAEFCNLYFAGMIYPTLHDLPGMESFGGNDYIILNPEVNRNKRKRTNISKVLITLGGSDPFGVTLEVVKEMQSFDFSIDIVVGPNFRFRKELENINRKNYRIYQNVPSLINMFYEYDLAISGGGITCCEANATGLPCIIIANAPHEINTGKYMEHLGGSIYAGEHGKWDTSVLKKIRQLPISDMSTSGMRNFDTKAIDRIFAIIEKRRRK